MNGLMPLWHGNIDRTLREFGNFYVVCTGSESGEIHVKVSARAVKRWFQKTKQTAGQYTVYAWYMKRFSGRDKPDMMLYKFSHNGTVG